MCLMTAVVVFDETVLGEFGVFDVFDVFDESDVFDD